MNIFRNVLALLLSLATTLSTAFAADRAAERAADRSTAAALVVGAPAALPAKSLYWLDLPLLDAGGNKLALHELQGAPLLVTMFYGNCATACPIILQNLKQTVAAIKPAPGKLRVLLVSLDPAHDNPATLSHLQQDNGLDSRIFRLAVSDNQSHTRLLAAALGINYRVLSSGEINHTTRVTLLDAAGVVRADSAASGVTPDPAFIKEIRQLMY